MSFVFINKQDAFHGSTNFERELLTAWMDDNRFGSSVLGYKTSRSRDLSGGSISLFAFLSISHSHECNYLSYPHVLLNQWYFRERELDTRKTSLTSKVHSCPSTNIT